MQKKKTKTTLLNLKVKLWGFGNCLRGRATGRRRLRQTWAYRRRHYSGSGIDSDPLLEVWILREYRRESERFGV